MKVNHGIVCRNWLWMLGSGFSILCMTAREQVFAKEAIISDTTSLRQEKQLCIEKDIYV